MGTPGMLGLRDCVELGLIHYDDQVNVMKSSSGMYKLSISDLNQPLLHILDTILVHCILHILSTILVHCLI